jgi:homoserine kinase type II
MNPASVFVVQHLRSEADSEDTKMVGVYTSREEAEAAVTRKRKFPGFSMFPNIVDPLKDEVESGFYISEMILNHDYWTEGFIYEPSES